MFTGQAEPDRAKHVADLLSGSNVIGAYRAVASRWARLIRPEPQPPKS